MSSTQEESPSTPELPPEDGLAALIARQAIVDEHRAVFGYELFDRTTALDSTVPPPKTSKPAWSSSRP